MRIGGVENNIIISPEGQAYVILNNVLGKGLFGTVSMAMKSEVDGSLTPIAAKEIILDRTSLGFEAQLAEIKKEHAIMQHLGRMADMFEVTSSNPNEMKIFVMQDLLVGVSLKKYLQDLNVESERLDPTDDTGRMRILSKAISAFIASCEATAELHEKEVIHGDLHANNIQYNTETRQARVLDFGMSHILALGSDKVYVPGVDDVAHIHRAPETLTPGLHQDPRHESDRVYYKNSDLYALAITFAVESEMTENYAPTSAKREVGQFLQLCYDLSRSSYLKDFQKEYGLQMDSREMIDKRITRTEAIQRLKGIQGQIEAKIAQRTLAPVSEADLQQAIEKRSKRSLSERSARATENPPKRGAAITWARAERETGTFTKDSGDVPPPKPRSSKR